MVLLEERPCVAGFVRRFTGFHKNNGGLVNRIVGLEIVLPWAQSGCCGGVRSAGGENELLVCNGGSVVHELPSSSRSTRDDATNTRAQHMEELAQHVKRLNTEFTVRLTSLNEVLQIATSLRSDSVDARRYWGKNDTVKQEPRTTLNSRHDEIHQISSSAASHAAGS